MKPEKFAELLILAGQLGQPSNVNSLPGVGVRSRVIFHSAGISKITDQISQMPRQDQEALIRGLALYEDSIGGVGSPTPLQRLFHMLDEPIDEVFDWVVNNTTSYDYFTAGAKSWQEMLARERAAAERRAINLAKEHERQEKAKIRRAEVATGNLFNAVRRGDVAAVKALLAKGANPEIKTPDGEQLQVYAESIGQAEISALLGNGMTDDRGAVGATD